MTTESSINTCADQPDTKPKPNPKSTTKQHAAVSIPLNRVMSYVSREIHTRQCCCTIFTTFLCECHSASESIMCLISVKLYVMFHAYS